MAKWKYFRAIGAYSKAIQNFYTLPLTEFRHRGTDASEDMRNYLTGIIFFFLQGNQWLPARIDVDLRGNDRVSQTKL